MILAHLSEFGTYATLHPLFAKVEEALATADFSSPVEKVVLEGDRLFALTSFSKARSKEEARLEAHNRYIDIQVCLQGTETMGWRNRLDCVLPLGDYSAGKDIIFFDDTPASYFTVPAGYFTIFFPNDCHAPLIGSGPIKKVVFKIELGGE